MIKSTFFLSLLIIFELGLMCFRFELISLVVLIIMIKILTGNMN